MHHLLLEMFSCYFAVGIRECNKIPTYQNKFSGCVDVTTTRARPPPPGSNTTEFNSVTVLKCDSKYQYNIQAQQ